MQGLRHAKYDLILTNHVSYDFGFIDEPLITVDWVCVMPADHRLAEKEVITPQGSERKKKNLVKLVDEEGIEWNRHKIMLEEHNIDVRFQYATKALAVRVRSGCQRALYCVAGPFQRPSLAER